MFERHWGPLFSFRILIKTHHETCHGELAKWIKMIPREHSNCEDTSSSWHWLESSNLSNGKSCSLLHPWTRAARAARAHTDFDRLKPMADDLKVPENKVPGCLSVVHASNLSMQYSWSWFCTYHETIGSSYINRLWDVKSWHCSIVSMDYWRRHHGTGWNGLEWHVLRCMLLWKRTAL